MQKLFMVSTILFLSGCAFNANKEPIPPIPHMPTDAWLSENLPKYKEQAEAKPTEKNVSDYDYLLQLQKERAARSYRANHMTRSLTLAWGNEGRGGAAMRQPAYIHVLGVSDPYQLEGGKKFSEADAIAIAEFLKEQNEAPSNDKAENKAQAGYSFYELSRWERFCDGGKGMDEKDWEFVTKENTVPRNIIPDCNPPSYDYKSYLNAWNRYCSISKDLSQNDKDIVGNSIRPQSNNNCKALLVSKRK